LTSSGESSTQSLGSFGGQQLGAAETLSLGYSWMLSSRFTTGVQVEGSVGNVLVQQSGTISSNQVFTPAGSPTFTQSVNQTSSDALASRWFVSALLKAGWVIDPFDSVYILGGWTHGNFEATTSNNIVASSNVGNISLDGGTLGLGFEHRFFDWGLNVEYRYTQFGNKGVNFQNILNSVEQGFQSTNVANVNANYAVRMQTVLVGASRYFSTY
jgi:opacity protein-like surface antigen